MTNEKKLCYFIQTRILTIFEGGRVACKYAYLLFSTVLSDTASKLVATRIQLNQCR